MTLPLEDIKILDLSRLLPGPYCSMLLSDLGADVLAIEMPAEGMKLPHVHRNKRSLTLNLKHEKGREILYKLLKSADVVLEGFRPGVTAKLGVDYETLKAIKPNLIYCSLTGFGQDGPYRDRPGHDINYIGYGGMLGGLGKAPAVPGTTLSDLGAAMFAVIAILAALMQRQKTGTGQYIDVAMLDMVMSWTGTEVGWTLAAGSMPAYGIFETKDGYITLAPIEPKFAANLETVLREAAAPEQKEKAMEPEVMAAILKTKTASDWLTLFNEAEIPCGPVYTPDEAFADPHVRHRGLIVESDGQLGKTRNVLFPVKFSNMSVQQIRRAPAAVGEHTDEVLKALGYSDDDIKALRDEGAV